MRSVKEGETIKEGKKGRGRSVKKRRDYQEKRRGRERRGEGKKKKGNKSRTGRREEGRNERWKQIMERK